MSDRKPLRCAVYTRKSTEHNRPAGLASFCSYMDSGAVLLASRRNVFR